MNSVVFVAGSSHPQLAQRVAHALRIKVVPVAFEKLPDGECLVQLHGNVKNCSVVVFQSLAPYPNDHLLELLLLLNAVQKGNACKIILVCPYFAYSRQAESLELVASIIGQFKVSSLIVVDLHQEISNMMLGCDISSITTCDEMVKAFKKFRDSTSSQENWIVVGPDLGSAKLATKYAANLGLDVALVDKTRVNACSVQVRSLLGDVKGKNVLLADDICSTAETLTSAAKACREKGAQRIVAAVSHGLFVLNALKQLQDSPIEFVLVSNTVDDQNRLCAIPYIKRVCIARPLAAALSRLIGISPSD